MRWVSALSQFQFVVKYRPGKVSTDCDFLSRLVDFSNYNEEINIKSVSAILQGTEVVDESPLYVNSFALFDTQCHLSDQCQKANLTNLKSDQLTDITLKPVYEAVCAGKKPTIDKLKQFSRKTKQLFRHFDSLFLNKNDVLMKKVQECEQIILPSSYHKMVYKQIHENMGHLGSDKVIELAKRRFYWPGMISDIETYVKKGCKCLKDRKPNKAVLGTIETTQPFEIISIDFLHLDRCKRGFEYLLVAVDNFTRFAQAYPTKNKSAKAAADKIFNDLVLHFGFPKRVHHDKGAEFNNKLWNRLHKLTGVQKSNTTPYHAMGNGQCERLNRTIIGMLKTLSDTEKSDWKNHVKKLTFAYNSTVCRSTGFSPHYLMFGRESRLPIDFMFETKETKEIQSSHKDFVDKWKLSI